MAHEIARMTPRHSLILEMYRNGMPKIDIAKEFGMSQQAISLITNSPIFQDELARKQVKVSEKFDDEVVSTVRDAKRKLEEKASKAADVHINLLTSQDDRIKQASANAILDRVGLPKQESRKSYQPDVIVVNEGQLQLIQNTLVEIKGGKDS